MKISEIIRILIILWFTEAIIAVGLYSPAELFINVNVLFLLLLKFCHFLFYYWALALIYYLNEDFSAKFFCITNSIVFLIISIILNFLLIKDNRIFFDYSFVCNLSAIIIAPYLLKKINDRLPSHLRIY